MDLYLFQKCIKLNVDISENVVFLLQAKQREIPTVLHTEKRVVFKGDLKVFRFFY